MESQARRRVPYAFFVVLFAALALVVSACGDSDESSSTTSGSDASSASSGPLGTLYTAAKKEGSVLWYADGGTGGMDRVAAAFKKKYPGIDVGMVRAASGPLATRFTQEVESGAKTADVYSGNDPRFWDTATSKGWFEAQLDLPAFESYPASFKTGGQAIIGILVCGLGFNKNSVSGENIPKEWKDIVGPAFKDKGNVTLGDPRAAIITMATYEYWREKYGDDFLKQVAANGFTLVPSTVPAVAQLASGATKLLGPASYNGLAATMKQGAPIDMAMVLPGITTSFMTGVASKSKHPNAARLLFNFLLTKEGQTAYNGGDGGTSPLGNLPGTRPLPAQTVTLASIIDSTVKNSDKILSLLGIE